MGTKCEICGLAGLWLFSVVPLSIAQAQAQPKPMDPNIYLTSTAWQEVMPEVVFWVNFDRSSRPVMGQSDTEVVEKNYQAKPGRVGNAFFSETGASCQYSAKGNLDFTRPGGLSFWACAKSWDFQQDEEPYNVFFSTPYSSKGYLGIERQGSIRQDGVVKRSAEILFFLLNFPGAQPNNNLSLRAAPESDWADGVWHFFVLNWKGSLYSASMDGESPRSLDIGRSLEAGEVQQFILGGTAEPTLIDEFMIFRRPLSSKEIHDIYGAMQ